MIAIFVSAHRTINLIAKRNRVCEQSAARFMTESEMQARAISAKYPATIYRAAQLASWMHGIFYDCVGQDDGNRFAESTAYTSLDQIGAFVTIAISTRANFYHRRSRYSRAFRLNRSFSRGLSSEPIPARRKQASSISAPIQANRISFFFFFRRRGFYLYKQHLQ